MQLNEYQEEALKFKRYPNPEYAFTNLASEAGEAMGKIAKLQRGDKGWEAAHNPIPYLKKHPVACLEVTKELGDCLCQLAFCCNELGITLEDLAAHNLHKLSDRKERGVIKGEGDER